MDQPGPSATAARPPGPIAGASIPSAPTHSAPAELASGWPILLACALGVGCSAIALPFYAIGPLTKPVAAATGWARSDIQFAILFSSGIGAVTAPVTGWMIERFGVRAVALPSLGGVSIGLLLASFATGLHGFWLGYAVAAILGAGSNPVLWSRVVAGSFERARGAALGLSLLGTAGVAFLLPYLVAAIAPAHGWRIALRLIALMPLVVALPVVALVLGRARLARRERGEGGLTVRQAFRTRRFWLLSGSLLLAYLAISGAGPNLVPALSDRGFGAGRAAAIASFYAVGMVPGRIVCGLLMDRFWAPLVAALMLTIPALACVLLRVSADPLALALGCAMIGIAAGAELDVLGFLTARYFGLAHYPRIYASSYVALAVGSATAPTIFSRIAEATGGATTSFTLCALLFVTAALPLLLLGPYPAAGHGGGMMAELDRPALPPLQDRLSFLVHRINAHLLRLTNPRLKIWKLDLTEARLMVALLEQGALPAGEIVSIMALPQSTISHQLKRLEKLGYISRTPGTRDSRLVIVNLTEAGRGVATEANAFSREITDQLVAAIGAAEIETIRAAMKRADLALATPRPAPPQ